MRMDFTCLLYFSVAHQFQNANTISNSPPRLSTLSISFSDSFCTDIRMCVCSQPGILVCISVHWNYNSFITSTLFSRPYPFRYLFNLIWFHFLVFSRLLSFFFTVSIVSLVLSHWSIGEQISIPVCPCFVPTILFPLLEILFFLDRTLYCSIIWSWLNQARELVFPPYHFNQLCFVFQPHNKIGFRFWNAEIYRLFSYYTLLSQNFFEYRV